MRSWNDEGEPCLVVAEIVGAISHLRAQLRIDLAIVEHRHRGDRAAQRRILRDIPNLPPGDPDIFWMRPKSAHIAVATAYTHLKYLAPQPDRSTTDVCGLIFFGPRIQIQVMVGRIRGRRKLSKRESPTGQRLVEARRRNKPKDFLFDEAAKGGRGLITTACGDGLVADRQPRLSETGWAHRRRQIHKARITCPE